MQNYSVLLTSNPAQGSYALGNVRGSMSSKDVEGLGGGVPQLLREGEHGVGFLERRVPEFLLGSRSFSGFVLRSDTPPKSQARAHSARGLCILIVYQFPHLNRCFRPDGRHRQL